MTGTTPKHAYEEAIHASGHLVAHDWSISIRPRRRSIGIAIEPGGHVVLAVPPTAPTERLTDFIGKKIQWIESHVGTSRDKAATPREVFMKQSEGFSFLGRGHLLRPVDADHTSAERQPCFTSWYLNIPRAKLAAHDPTPVIEWYKTEGTQWAQATAPQWQRRLLLREAPTIRVTDLGKRRWGVYRPKRHAVELHWTLFQLTPDLAELVLVHELAHATRPGGTAHGVQWQRRMSAVMPQWRRMQKLLNTEGRKVWTGEVQAGDRQDAVR
ncbi:hypothetical protein GCM10012285_60210 [Streptomyces kronopolitis]|uniref:YgjP-like metallopeptidase domain-containing protein n=1 Tax=Streptomyces kronopolitis TaxID=1612435 RepID=A0ABQ2K0D5_9ACTN|nr:YgjP-like metallopeptidase domain-containing protein [Streptomyces kronopolitis]GGN61387.1 hypothetical protein GCM10012285_60210 [Streptomyces kronopolitis]